MVLWFRECKEGTVVVRAVESTAVMRSTVYERCCWGEECMEGAVVVRRVIKVLKRCGVYVCTVMARIFWKVLLW